MDVALLEIAESATRPLACGVEAAGTRSSVSHEISVSSEW